MFALVYDLAKVIKKTVTDVELWQKSAIYDAFSFFLWEMWSYLYVIFFIYVAIIRKKV